MATCKTCWKTLNPYTPKPYCNVTCEKKGKIEMPEWFDKIFWWLYNKWK